jgi:hypothetical protein
MDALLYSILIIWYRNAGLKGASVENTLVFWCTVLTVDTSPPVWRERQKFIALLRASPDPDLSTSVLQLRNISLPWPAAYPSACLPGFRGMSVPRVPADLSLVHEDPTCEKHACVPCRAVPCHAMPCIRDRQCQCHGSVRRRGEVLLIGRNLSGFQARRLLGDSGGT